MSDEGPLIRLGWLDSVLGKASCVAALKAARVVGGYKNAVWLEPLSCTVYIILGMLHTKHGLNARILISGISSVQTPTVSALKKTYPAHISRL